MTEATVTTHDNEDLLAQLDAEPERGSEWKPEEEGDTILGRISAFSHPTTKDGRILPVLIVETDEGPTRVPVKHGVLRDELLSRKVQVGDRLAIRYLGERTGEKSGRTYFGYKVAVIEEGPRDESKAFSLEPRGEDPGDDFTEEAEAAVATEEPLF